MIIKKMKILISAFVLQIFLLWFLCQPAYSTEDEANCGGWVQVGDCMGGCADAGETGTAKFVKQNCPNAIKFQNCNSNINCKSKLNEKEKNKPHISFAENENKNNANNANKATNKNNAGKNANNLNDNPVLPEKPIVDRGALFLPHENENTATAGHHPTNKILSASNTLYSPIAAHNAFAEQETKAKNTATEDGPPDFYCVEFSTWTDWTPCDKNCNGGWREKSRLALSKKNVGKNDKSAEAAKCTNQLIDEDHVDTSAVKAERCATEKACADDGQCTEWTNWTDCDKKCGSGKRERHRQYNKGFTSCTGGTVQTDPCNTQSCTVPSGCAEWTNWTDCDGPCGFREIHRQAKPGKYCRQTYYFEKCREAECGDSGASTAAPTQPPGTTAPEAPREEAKEGGAGGANIGAIAGGVIGGVVLLGAGGALYYRYRKKKSEKDETAETGQESYENEGKMPSSVIGTEQEQEIFVDEDLWADSNNVI